MNNCFIDPPVNYCAKDYKILLRLLLHLKPFKLKVSLFFGCYIDRKNICILGSCLV